MGALGVLFVANKMSRPKRKHKKWSKKWLQERSNNSDVKLLKELSDEPPDFLNYLRMSWPGFEKLLTMVSHSIQKKKIQ